MTQVVGMMQSSSAVDRQQPAALCAALEAQTYPASQVIGLPETLIFSDESRVTSRVLFTNLRIAHIRLHRPDDVGGAEKRQRIPTTL